MSKKHTVCIRGFALTNASLGILPIQSEAVCASYTTMLLYVNVSL